MVGVDLDLEYVRRLSAFCEGKGVSRVKCAGIEIEFFPRASEPMALDPVALSKILTDSMPPDSVMMFAANEDPIHEPHPGEAKE